ncbi:MAG TPA: Synerg-CTERM sorting domain-containing protein, partial [Anaeromyxobacteraceae bacterium]
ISTMCAIATAVAARVPSWAWSYHAFSTGLTQSVATESSTTLGYRTIRNGCANLTGIPIYLTQAGRAAGSWTTADLSWLAWLDARLAEDGEVFGAALFEAGGTDRSLAPIVTQLAAFLQNPSAPDGGTPDAGADAGQGGIAGNGGGFVPGGPPGNYPKSGCASAGAGAGLALLAAVTPLLLRRRRGTSPRPTSLR